MRAFWEMDSTGLKVSTQKRNMIIDGTKAIATSPERTIMLSRGIVMSAVRCEDMVAAVLLLEFHDRILTFSLT